MSTFYFLFFFSPKQEEIKKHLKIHLSDFVSEWGKQRHSYLCSGTGVEPPQSLPVSGITKKPSILLIIMCVIIVCNWILFPSLFLFIVPISVRLFFQYVQWVLEGVQHDGNQLGDPRPEHRH